MRSIYPFSFILPLLLVIMIPANSQTNARMQKSNLITIRLNSGWQFREASKDSWYPATVPGSVHTDLMKNQLIGDSFYRDNEQKQQWIGKTDWEYRSTFRVSQEVLNHENLELVFDGLDTYADVFLNDVPVLKADNMFRTWRVNCANRLKPGDNTLRIYFRSPINEVLPLMAKMSYQLPASNDQGEKTSPHTRKAPYQFGWDWGPRLVTSGIWKSISIEAWDKARISDLHIAQNLVSKESAGITANVTIEASGDAEAHLIIEDVTNKIIRAKKEVKLSQGTNKFPLEFEILRPALWWPNGLGPHPLYNLKARLLIGRKLLDERST
ncbi:MAG TPA: hypothetical protein VFH91_03660, partial [Pyrinomonadaceae bacterium]|nr:hypothetical protein [Pyrinomonadaceae bacterium]